MYKFSKTIVIIALLFSLNVTLSAQEYPDAPDFTATAFFVSNDGMAVTNYHVIEESKQILLFDPHAGWSAVAHIIATDPYNDLAVLQADVISKALPVANRFALKRGDEVLTLGYPSPLLQGVQQKATFGKINADTGAGDDIRLVQIDVPIQPGNSGGPLLSGKGEIVGVISARLQAEYQNVGYAIKVDYLYPLLSKASITPVSSPLFSRFFSTSRIVDASQDSVVMVLGYRESKPGRGENTNDAANGRQKPGKTSTGSRDYETEEAALRGEAWAQFNLGWMYEQGRGVPKDDAKAVGWYQKAADQGLADAQVNLGWMYEQGRGVPKDDAKAVDWYQKAADQGNAWAQNNLGVMYQQGRGVPKNDAKAVGWYQKAADQGDAGAQVNLGMMYGQGLGVPKDDVKAVEWFQKAADQGHAPAQVCLGVMYFYGQGIIRDRQKGCELVRKAAEQREKWAIEFYNGNCAD